MYTNTSIGMHVGAYMRMALVGHVLLADALDLAYLVCRRRTHVHT